MKKFSWILALLAALAVVFVGVGCGGGGGDDDGLDPNFTSDLAGMIIKLEKNEYAENKDESRGLQAKFTHASLMQGRQIKAGDTFTLDIEFTIDKELDYDLEIGFVDTTVGESEGYWRGLTWDNHATPKDDMYKIPKAELTGTIAKKIDFTAKKGASSAAVAANCLTIESRDLWTKEPVSLTFTKFLFVYGEGGEAPPPPPPPIEVAPVFTAAADGKSITHDNFSFALSTSSSHGSQDITDKGDNSFLIKTGAVRYKFPVLAGTFNVADYDFVDITYTAEDPKDLVYKHYDTSADYLPFSAGITAGEDKVITFELRNTTSGGVAIQKWSAVSVEPHPSITFSEVNFKKGTRHNVTFNVDGGTALPGTYLVEGTKVGTHLPVPVKAGYLFTGWEKGSDKITVATEVDASFANAVLKATWLLNPSRTPLNIALSSSSFDASKASATVTLIGTTGYEIDRTAGYGNSSAMFAYTFTGDTRLHDFDKVTLTYQGVTGDLGSKKLILIASTAPVTGYSADFEEGKSGDFGIAGFNVTGTDEIAVTINIDRAKAFAALNQATIYIGFQVHANPNKYKINNITFAQN